MLTLAADAPSMTPLFVIGGYLLLLAGLGYASSRFFRGTSKDYFVASRSIGPFMLLMSVFGTTMTGFALVGSSAKSFQLGIGVYGLMASWSGLIHSACFFLVGIKLWAIGKRYGYVTQVQFFRNRFESPVLGYMLFPILVALVIPYLLVGIIAACKTMLPITRDMFPTLFESTNGSLPPWLTGLVICGIVLFYVFFGGVRSAAWANTFQTLVFMVTGIIAFTMISRALGGLDAAGQMVAEHQPARLAREGQISQAHFFSYLFIPFSVGMFPHLFQHWLTARSAKTFRLTVVAHPVFIAIVWVPCVLIGVWAAGKVAAGELNVPNPNAALGAMVGQLVENPFLTGLLTAGILAAIMSSLDSQFVCLGTMFTNDIVTRVAGKNRFSDRQMVWLARGFIVGVVMIAYLLSMLLLNVNVFNLGVWCFSGFASLFPLVFAAIYWKRATATGAIVSLIATVVVWTTLIIDALVLKENAIFGKVEHGEYLVAGVMPVTFIFATAVISMVVVSLMTKPPSARTIEKFFPGGSNAA